MSDINSWGTSNSNGNYREDYGNEPKVTGNGLNHPNQNGHTRLPAEKPSEQVNSRNKATQPLPGREEHFDNFTRHFSGPESVSLTLGGQVALAGTLNAFSPSSLLSLFNIQKQTGMLHMRNEAAIGAIYIEKGEVFDARLDTVTGALALFQLFGWKSGDFVFETNVAAPNKRTIEASLPVLQVRATLWLDNWNKYNPIIPTTSHRIGIAAEPRSEVMIEPYHWAILTRIVNTPTSIAVLANDLKQDVMTITRIAADLVKMGVAVVYPPDGSENQVE
jgi:hypothetical protein